MNTFLAFYQNLGPALTLLVIGTFLLAGTVKGVIGLGLPTVAMGMLGLAMLPAQAAALLIIPSTVTNLWQLAFGGHLRGLLIAAAQCNKAGVEVAHIGFEDLGGVACRVNRYKDHLQLIALGAQLLFDSYQVAQGGGAHVRALREAKEQQGHFAFEIRHGALLAVLVWHGKVLRVLFTTRQINRIKAGLASARLTCS